MEKIECLLEKLNIKPHNIEFFELAFTHSSYNADAKTKHHDYERLEFLGDSYLGAVVSELAYKAHPDMAQGPLTKLKSALVSTSSLAKYARKCEFEKYIRVGNSFHNDIAKSDTLLEDVFEAFLGALFLDQGYVITRKFIISLIYPDIQSYQLQNSTDYKSRLQEEVQAEHRESVAYRLVKEEGPAHDKTFTVEVVFDDIVLGVGVGSTKKKAEQEAAKAALEKRVKI